MRLKQYLSAEQLINAADRGSIIERWKWGRLILTDPDILTESGRLKNGVRERLIRQATACGCKLSESEISYRIQCAERYSKESQIITAVANYDSWTSLREAKFPVYSVDHSELDYDPREHDKPKRTRPKNPGPQDWDIRELFPEEKYGPDTPLAELEQYARDCDDVHARFGIRNQARWQLIAEAKRKGATPATTLQQIQDELDLWSDEP